VAILCSNNLQAIQSIYALSKLGVHIYFLNSEISQTQLEEAVIHKNIDLIIYSDIIDSKTNLINCQKLRTSEIDLLINKVETKTELPKVKAGKLVILSGGTTGKPKSAKRKQSIKNFLNPLVALLSLLNLNTYKSVYIATPFYHGFGLASLIISILLGSEIYLLEKFDSKKASKMIEVNTIEVVTLVPVMLKRLLAEDLKQIESLKRIICGGAKLDKELVKQTLSNLGNVLYNLYGTTEAGFSILASPKTLKSNPLTIGKPIRGVSLKVIDENNKKLKANEIGQLHLSTSWIMNNSTDNWINTDDLGYINTDGLVFLAGRSDNMIISGGENVYPDEVENILIEHPLIEEVAVAGTPDIDFGERLIAYIVLTNETINKDTIPEWCKTRLARHQMPKQLIYLTELPRTSIGKVDKKQLV
jgi:acyl-CoA synthetase (AMP-forming)/AMP-acid ligase II